MHRPIWRAVAISAALAVFVLPSATALAAPPPSAPGPHVATVQNGDSGPAIHHDTSRPLRDYKPTHTRKGEDHADVELPIPAAGVADPVVQTSAPAAAAPTVTSFEGIGQGNITISGAPPDPNAAVGPTQVVEVVNTSLGVFNKSTGAFLLGPENTNTLWSGFGGTCQTTNDGDATVRYDRAADRWVVTQFANVRSTSGPYQECVAVSTSGDATGTWFRYAFQFANFPDYPKISVWPDAYYITYNTFNPAGTTFLGGEECAYDRAKMLTGAAATQQCFTTSTTFAAPLPADWDGSTAPPAGANNLMVTVGSTSTTLAYWRFHVDWTTPASSTLTGPTNLTVASYTLPCGGTGGTCIPQSGTTNQLDTLGDRMMYRSAYRNLGDHESVVLTHSVASGSTTGMRWYELRLSGGVPSVFQQSTFAPDATARWMGSIAMDKAGGIALGYSAASSSLSPAIRVTGRVATDALNTMTQGETTIQSGASQTGGLTRWGDYTSMAVDPSDDCTFYYTNQYLAAAGSFNWHTRIGHFVLPNCTAPPANDFSISVSPTSGTVTAGGSTTATVSTATTSGSAQTVNLSASGLPSGATATFSPASVTSGGSSTMTITTSTSTPAGTSTITITGTGTSATHSTPYTLTVNGTGGCGSPGQKLGNPGFETGSAPWTATAGVIGAFAGQSPHSGTRFAWLDGYGTTHTDTLTQAVTLPAGCTTYQLTFWLHIDSAETTTTTAFDTLKVQIIDGATTTTLVTYSNLNKAAGYSQKSFSLNAFAGHAITVKFLGAEDSSLQTSFVVDDTALNVS